MWKFIAVWLTGLVLLGAASGNATPPVIECVKGDLTRLVEVSDRRLVKQLESRGYECNKTW